VYTVLQDEKSGHFTIDGLLPQSQISFLEGNLMFSLHPQLAKDCEVIGDLPLCKVLLCNDANYPWVILVPRREDIREQFQLADEDQQLLLIESNFVAQSMNEAFKADKMNVAALGNQVPQLHIHHIVRYADDQAWPGPVWGAVPKRDYAEEALSARVEKLRGLLASAGLQSAS
jgi:diadenosine tetraphosphate (Ap4A) HIT family hydrolase